MRAWGLAVDAAAGPPIPAQEVRIDVPITGIAVTQSLSDATIERLTKTGGLGVGPTAPSVGNASVTDSRLALEVYAYATASGSAEVSRGLLLHGHRNANGGKLQLMLVELSSPVNAMASGGIVSRGRTSGAWSPWLRSHGAASILGQVAQAGGCYVRIVDVTQICDVTTAAQASDIAMDTLFDLVRACIRAVAVDGGRALDLVLIA